MELRLISLVILCGKSCKDASTENIEIDHQVLASTNPLIIEILKNFSLKRPTSVTIETVELQLEASPSGR